MDLARTREFLLTAYHDLPNVLFVSALILGSVSGYLSLVWVALGMLLNSGVVAILQGILHILFPNWDQIVSSASTTCNIFGRAGLRYIGQSDVSIIAPSYWMSATVFFAVFSIYNSLRIALRPATTGAVQEKVDARRAFSLSTLVIGIMFLFLLFARGFSGCESWLGGILGIAVGGGMAIGYWHLLDACGAGRIPDLLQVIHNIAPSNPETPIVCTPPSN